MSGDHNKYHMKVEFPARYKEKYMNYLQNLIDSDEFESALGTLIDYAMAKELLESRDRMIADYELAIEGYIRNIFVMGDPKKDAKKMKKYIKAYDLLIDMYTVNHTFYDFNTDE